MFKIIDNIYKIKAVIYKLLCALFIIILGFYGMCAIIVSIIPSYKQEIISYIEKSTDYHINIPKITASWHGLKIYIQASDVVLKNKAINDLSLKPEESIEVSDVKILMHPMKTILFGKLVVDQVSIEDGKLIFNQEIAKDSSFTKNPEDTIRKYINDLRNQNKFFVQNFRLKNISINQYRLDKLKIHNSKYYLSLYTILLLPESSEKLEFAAKYNKANVENISRADHQFYFSTNSSQLYALMTKNLIETNRLKEINFHPNTLLKIWGSLKNTDIENLELSPDLHMHLDSPQIKIVLDFEKVLELKEIHGDFTYSNKSKFNFFDKFHLKLDDFRVNLAGSDFIVKADIVREEKKKDLQIVSNIDFGHVDIKKFLSQLPGYLLENDTGNWLKNHIEYGQIGDARILWRGNINSSFPYDSQYDKPEGVFLLRAELLNVNIDYSKVWPKVYDMNAVLLLRGRELNIASTDAKISHSNINNISVKIPGLGIDNIASAYTLQLQSKINTTSEDLVQIIQHTPLNTSIGSINNVTKFSGPMGLSLDLSIPLLDYKKITVAGNLEFLKNKLEIKDTPFVFNELTGKLFFTDHGVSGENIRSVFNNKEAKMNLSLDQNNKKGLSLNLTGWFDFDNLNKHLDLISDKYITGVTPFIFNLKQKGKDVTIRANSELEGIAIKLPKTWFNNAFNKKPQQKLVVKLIMQEDGVKHISNLTVHNSSKISSAILNQKTHKISSFSYFNSSKLSSVALDTDDIIGNINFIKNKNKDVEAIFADLNKLVLYQDDDPKREPLALQNKEFLNFPNIVLKVDNFNYNNVDLGKLLVNTKVEKKDKKFIISNSSLNGQNLNLSLNAEYIVDGESKIQGTYKIKNLPKIISVFDDVVFREKIKFDGRYNISWPKNLLDFDMSIAGGELTIDSGYGKIYDVELGIGRLFGFFNLGSIEKRLRLDFSDVFEPGFKFDDLRGKFTLKDGILTTTKAKLAAGSADVELYGGVNIIEKTYDMKADITPHVTSGLPVAAAVVGTPVAGAVVFLVDKILESPVDQISERAYSITGAWKDPKVKKLKNKRGSLIELSWLKDLPKGKEDSKVSTADNLQ